MFRNVLMKADFQGLQKSFSADRFLVHLCVLMQLQKKKSVTFCICGFGSNSLKLKEGNVWQAVLGFWYLKYLVCRFILKKKVTKTFWQNLVWFCNSQQKISEQSWLIFWNQLSILYTPTLTFQSDCSPLSRFCINISFEDWETSKLRRITVSSILSIHQITCQQKRVLAVTDFVALSKGRAFGYTALNILNTEYCIVLQRLLIVTLLLLLQNHLKGLKEL